jgi:hypothetical protein
LRSGWWYLRDTSPCIDAGIPIHDNIGAHVRSLYPDYGWGDLIYLGSAPDIGANEFGESEVPLSAPYISIEATNEF